MTKRGEKSYKSGKSIRRIENRNDNETIGKYQMSESDELLIQDIAKIETIQLVEEDSNGKVFEWYGQRLKLLRLFYNKSLNKIATFCGYSEEHIGYFERNKYKPKPRIISQLSLLFEVPESFFTDREITIKIKGQLNIELI